MVSDFAHLNENIFFYVSTLRICFIMLVVTHTKRDSISIMGLFFNCFFFLKVSFNVILNQYKQNHNTHNILRNVKSIKGLHLCH